MHVFKKNQFKIKYKYHSESFILRVGYHKLDLSCHIKPRSLVLQLTCINCIIQYISRALSLPHAMYTYRK